MRRFETADSRKLLARRLARESIVMLENKEETLPLAAGTKVALLGRTQNDVVFGGGGSGSSRGCVPVQIREALIESGLVPESGLDAFYQEVRRAELENAPGGEFDLAKFAGLVASGMIYEFFGKYKPAKEEPIPEDALFAAAAAATDTAILIVGRAVGGEECDRRVENDYYLLDSEKELIRRTAEHFAKVIVVADVCGPVDLAWVRDYPQIRALLYMGTSGEQAAAALAEILTGKVTPSGHLSVTLALRYEDYPTAHTMFTNKDEPEKLLRYENFGLSPEENGSHGFKISPVTLYEEDIYVGYRYFDSFDKEVLYPFGYGLSYAEFEMEAEEVKLAEGAIRIRVRVQNTSERYAGKETAQVYLRCPSAQLPQAYQQLKAFAKTDLLAPGESQVLEMEIPVAELATFNEDAGAYQILEGTYELMLGDSSRHTESFAQVRVDEEITVRKISADMGMLPCNRDKVELMRPEEMEETELSEALPILRLIRDDVKLSFPSYQEHSFEGMDGEGAGEAVYTLKDVAEGRISMERFVAQMSVKELAVLLNGYGPGLPFGGVGMDVPSTIKGDDGEDIGYNSHPSANPGYENPAIRKYGIYSAFYKDGPASVGMTGWTTGMMLSCTFNKELLYAFGEACGYESEIQDVDAWLAPGMNIIRNPIEGRAFEYFSEDPYLCGVCGLEIARCAQENNEVSVCPKHFALNEQETYRRGSTRNNIDAVDSIVSARAAREIYLKPFEMVITGAKPRVVMTSFNKINGTFAGGHRALNTDILRGEWGYDGVVVTDWGDMDIVVDGADAVEAGNDVVMPGGPPVIAQVLKGYEEGRVSLDRMREAVCHLMNFVMASRSYKTAAKND